MIDQILRRGIRQFFYSAPELPRQRSLFWGSYVAILGDRCPFLGCPGLGRGNSDHFCSLARGFVKNCLTLRLQSPKLLKIFSMVLITVILFRVFAVGAVYLTMYRINWRKVVRF